MLLDRVAGMLILHALGDALGAPHEFARGNGNIRYTGVLEIEPYRQKDSRFVAADQREVRLPVGSVTDDTQMTMALAKMLIAGSGVYRRDNAILAYAAWVHCKPPGMGKNTRAVFKNKTVRGYETSMSKIRVAVESGTEPPSLSNGALMRCSSLALLANWEEAAYADTYLTNPYPETIACTLLYVWMLRSLLLATNADANGAENWVLEQIPSVCQGLCMRFGEVPLQRFVGMVGLAMGNEMTDIASKNVKGLATTALYYAVRSLVMHTKGYDHHAIIRWVITQNTEFGSGDTDTNAAIAGAVLGACIGYTKLLTDPTTASNYHILRIAASCVVPPLAFYSPTNLESLATDLVHIARRTN